MYVVQSSGKKLQWFIDQSLRISKSRDQVTRDGGGLKRRKGVGDEEKEGDGSNLTLIDLDAWLLFSCFDKSDGLFNQVQH